MTDLPPRFRIADEDVYVRVGDVLDHLNSRDDYFFMCDNCDEQHSLWDVYDESDILAALDAAIIESRRKGL